MDDGSGTANDATTPISSVSRFPSTNVHDDHATVAPPRVDDDVDVVHPGASWSIDTTSTFNGQVLSFDGSLGYENVELFRDAQIALERGSIYGLVAPNGAGKTSFVRALPTLPGLMNHPPGRFRTEYLAADWDTTWTTTTHVTMTQSQTAMIKNILPRTDSDLQLNQDGSMEKDIRPVISTLSARAYCLGRVDRRCQELEKEIEFLEEELENATDNDVVEQVSTQLGELYERKDDLEVDASARLEQMLEELQFGRYMDQAFETLSSGWKYKCQLVSALLTRPDLLLIDEPSFLDTRATAWLVTQLQSLAKSHNAMVVLISHKEALLEELCDRILYLNPASRTLMVYHCGYREFQAAHANQVATAQKSKDLAVGAQQQAKQSLGHIREQLHKRELSYKAKTTENARNKTWIRGKNKEAKQNADHSAAAKLKQLQKEVKVQEEQQALFLQSKSPPLELKGADTVMNRPLVDLVDVDFGYEGSELLLQYVNCQVAGTDKILVQGANGQGKSTIAKLILGHLDPTHGEIRRSPHTVAHFHQDALLELIRNYGRMTAVEFLQQRKEHLTETDARTYLGGFGLKGNIAVRNIDTLSAGQRVRLWLSREFLIAKPSLLILDEVTENLDHETTDSLLESLQGISAAVLAISHDDYFAERYPATQIWTVGNGHVRVAYQ